MGQSRSNFILIGAIAVLAVLALIPEWKGGSVFPNSEKRKAVSAEFTAVPRAASGNTAIMDGINEAVAAMDRHIADLAAAGHPEIAPSEPTPPSFAVTNPSEPHRLLPLVPGAEWVFRVTGPAAPAPDDTWTLRTVSEPEGQRPGMVELGYGDRLSFAPIFSEAGSLRFEALPYVAPTGFGAEPLLAMPGELLPHIARIVNGAVWTKGSVREVLYNYVDEKGERHVEHAMATESDRAQAGPFETVIVPAGRFGAHRIEWLSRVDIKAKGRPVLTDLTTAPYRKETMWVAPGIGIVRRDITYLLAGRVQNKILFELIRYQLADDCIFQDVAPSPK